MGMDGEDLLQFNWANDSDLLQEDNVAPPNPVEPTDLSDDSNPLIDLDHLEDTETPRMGGMPTLTHDGLRRTIHSSESPEPRVFKKATPLQHARELLDPVMQKSGNSLFGGKQQDRAKREAARRKLWAEEFGSDDGQPVLHMHKTKKGKKAPRVLSIPESTPPPSPPRKRTTSKKRTTSRKSPRRATPRKPRTATPFRRTSSRGRMF